MKERIVKFVKSTVFRTFLIFLAICFAAYVGYLNQNYIGDNYGGRVNGYDQMSMIDFFNAPITISNGRHMSITYWLLHAPLSKIGIDYFHNQWVFFAIDITILAIAATIIYQVFSRVLKLKKHSIPLIAAIAIIAVNPFICDALVYLLPSHPQALLFVALSLFFLTREKGSKKGNYLLTLLFLTLAISTYQSYYSFYAILALPLIFMQQKGKVDKQFFKRIAIAIVIMATSIALVMIACKVHSKILHIANMKDTAISLSPAWLFNRLKLLLKPFFIDIRYNYYLFPPYLILGIIGSITVALSVIMIRAKKIKELIVVLFMLIFGFFSPIYFGIVAETFYLAPRILPAIFASVSIAIILLFYYCPKIQKNSIFAAGTVAVLLINIYCCSTFITDLHISNQIEVTELRTISQRIEQYEKGNNTKIEIVKVHSAGSRTKQ